MPHVPGLDRSAAESSESRPEKSRESGVEWVASGGPYYTARCTWQRQAHEAFVDNRYSRRHALRFDGGAEWAGSSSPHVVPLPLSDAHAVDPEELFVASLSSCHMLWFLSLAAAGGYCIDRYVDNAAGEMGRNTKGQWVMTVVTLRPQVVFSGARVPSSEVIEQLHRKAHGACFIAHSVLTEVRCEPVI
jgi:organic hydroperoxide reductase OsmC/OhrA